jgi:GTPase SAR1 family protein
MILIGTKIDLRDTQTDCVTQKEGKRMKKRIGAVKYLECTALKNEGLDDIFVEAVRATIVRAEKANYCYPFQWC